MLLDSQYQCSPLRYNQQVFEKPFGPSMPLRQQESMAFAIWNESINLEKCKPLIKLLKRHYNVPPFTTTIEFIGNPLPNIYGVTPVREALNTVYQAKYGLFTCADTHRHIGSVNYSRDLVNLWEKSSQREEDLWYLALAYALKKGVLTFDGLHNFRIQYSQNPQAQAQAKKLGRPKPPGALTKLDIEDEDTEQSMLKQPKRA